MRGAGPAQLMPVILDIRCEIKSSSEGAVLWRLQTETAASAYTQQIFYNLDLASGKDLTLSDVLGRTRQIPDKAVKRYHRPACGGGPEKWPYFVPTGKRLDEGFQGIADDRSSYIPTRDGNVVVELR